MNLFDNQNYNNGEFSVSEITENITFSTSKKRKINTEIKILVEILAGRLLSEFSTNNINIDNSNGNINVRVRNEKFKINEEENKNKQGDNNIAYSLTTNDFITILNSLQSAYENFDNQYDRKNNENENELKLTSQKSTKMPKIETSSDFKNNLLNGFSHFCYGFRASEIISTLSFFSNIEMFWDDLNLSKNIRLNEHKNKDDQNMDNKSNYENKLSNLQSEILKIFSSTEMTNFEIENLRIFLLDYGVPENDLLSIIKKNDNENDMERNAINSNFNTKTVFKSAEENSPKLSTTLNNKNKIISVENIQDSDKSVNVEISRKFSPFPSWVTLDELRDLMPKLLNTPNFIPNLLWSCHKKGFTLKQLMVIKFMRFFVLKFLCTL